MSECIRSTSVVLLPGMMCDAELWTAQLERLGADYDVSVGDITGADSIAAIAEQVLETAPPSFALAGLSMGGIVALEMWRRAPERIERLALLDTNYRSDSPERQQLRDRQVNDVNAGAIEQVLRDELKPNYLARCHQSNLTLLDQVLAMGMALGAEVFTRQSLALRNRPDSANTLPTINCPTLVLCGAEDRLCTPELHRDMAVRIPGASLQVIADCGHLSTMEQPDRVNEALLRWLQPNEE